MKLFLTLLLITSQILSSVALAKASTTLLIPPPNTDDEEYRSALDAYKNHISVEEWQLQQSPSIAGVQNLIQKFSLAESSFVDSQDTQEIKKNYQELLELESTEDWRLSEQKIFFISYLRLIQIDSDLLSAERRSFLEHAALYLSRMEAPKNLIPPPILREVDERKAQFTWQSYRLPDKVVADFSKVLISGKLQSTHEPILLPREIDFPLRFRFLSSKRPSQTKIISQKELEALAIQSEAYVTGTCGSYSLTEAQSHRFSIPSKIYEPLNCYKKTSDQMLEKGKTANQPREISLPGLSSENKASWKMKPKHWVWLGLGGVALALLASQVKKKNESGSTTSTPGESHGL